MILVENMADLCIKVITILTGVTGVFVNVRKYFSMKKNKGISDEQKQELHDKRLKQLKKNAILFLIIPLLFVGALLAYQNYTYSNSLAANTNLTSSAWDLYNGKKYNEAIGKAKECVDQFGSSAMTEQKKLADANTALPPTGSVPDDQYKEIIARGTLNDVGTSWYIIGSSYEKLGNKEEAKKAYAQAAKFTYARCWDPKGWFWSPSQEASARLEGLQ